MREEYVDKLDDTLDDVEPVVDNPAELYEHFRVVVDKGQSQVARGQIFVRTACQLFAQPYSEGCRRRPHHGERQTGEKQL